MAQLYTSKTALKRLRANKCPECGFPTGRHDGGGGPNGCMLTDNGVAQRIYAQQQLDKSKRT